MITAVASISESGYRQRPGWPTWFRRLATEHAAMIEAYCRVLADVPYYYTERANTGLLGSAAWKAGLIALEEYNCEKARDDGPRPGRADLYVYNSRADVGLSIECKQYWLRSGSTVDDMERTVISATNDAYYAPETTFNAGCVFFLPSCPAALDDDELEEKLDKMFQRVLSIPHDCLFWSFPRATRRARGAGRYKDMVYPGVMTLLRKVT